MGTGKYQPEGPTFQRLAEFPTGAYYPWVSSFLLSLKIIDQFFFSHAIKKTVPFVSHMEMLQQNVQKKKFHTKPTIFVTKMFLLFQLRQQKLTLDVFVHK